MHVRWVHWPWREPTASAEVPLRTLFEWFLSWSPTGLNYYLPFPPLPRFLLPSLLIPHHSFSLEHPVRSPLLSFSGVLLWSARTAGEPLTTVCVCVCVWRWVGCGGGLSSLLQFALIFSDLRCLPPLPTPLSKHTSSSPHPGLTSSSSPSTSSNVFVLNHFMYLSFFFTWWSQRATCDWNWVLCI